ncbi:MAG: hypothetical protein KDD99_01955 [Bacteroidetes bacterium]|nr:hypothetical protein [Bacteroidota bacterium]
MEYIFSLMNEPDSSFWHISDLASHYFSTTSDSIPEGLAKRYGRWYYFWRPRVDTTGNRRTPNQKMLEIAADMGGTLDSYTIGTNSVCSENGAWKLLGPIITTTQVSGVVRSIYAPPGQLGPTPAVIYAGSNTGGLWKTEDGGITWDCKTDVLRVPGLGVSKIAALPHATNHDFDTIYIATGHTGAFMTEYGVGMFKSVDGGTSWDTTGLGFAPSRNSVTFDLIIDPENSNNIYAITEKKFHRSNDGGETFTNLILKDINGDPIPITWGETLFDLEILKGDGIVPGGDDILFIATATGHKVPKVASLYRSYDYGDSWTDITPGNANNTISFWDNDSADAFMFATVPDLEPNSIYVTYREYSDSTPRNRALIRSIDFGDNWTDVTPDIVLPTNAGNCDDGPWVGAVRPAFEINQVDSNLVMYFATNCLAKTDSAAAANNNIDFVTEYGGAGPGNPSPTHADIRAIQVYQSTSGGTNDVILIGTDGGVSISSNGGNTWANINGTELVLTQFFDIANPSQREEGFAGGGAQDNGTLLRINNTWGHRDGGDGGQVIVDWKESESIIFGKSNANATKSTNGGISFGNIWVTLGKNGVHPFPIRQHPHQPKTIYVGRWDLFFTIDHTGDSLLQPKTKFSSSFPDFRDISTFEIAPSDPDIIYLTTDKSTGYIWKSFNGGLSWAQITPQGISKDNFKHHVVEAIAIDPENSQRVWMGLSTFIGKVVFSEDGGITWSSLPDLPHKVPVNDLEYQWGTNDVLYAATDVGVYRYDPDNGWQCFNDSLPATIITDLEINYCDGTIHAGTYGRGIWRSPLWSIPPDTITQDTTWDYTTNVGGDLYIESGVTLTIKGLVNMGKGKGIFVKPNARLIVDGGTITNQCGGFWRGIEVWGDKTKDQFPLSHPTDQGKVEIKNGALIAHARNAISMGKGLTNSTIPSGGLVIASNSTFKNNRRAVEFLSYKHLNQSKFTNCTFTVDDAFQDSVEAFTSHITMWDVKNVQITACTFKNEMSAKVWTLNRGNGIHSIDAGFIIKGTCSNQGPNPGTPCPEANLTRTVFDGFNRGIQATGTSTNNTINVKQALFDDNVLGVWIDNMDNISITRSLFEIGANSTTIPGNQHEGIVLLESTDYRIEENTFDESANPIELSWGIRIRNGQTADNQVYKNSFDGMDQGLYSEGLNRNPNNAFEGLQFLCNDHQSMQQDIFVNPITSELNSTDHGMRTYQGSTSLSAGNTFTQASSGTPSRDFRNDSDWPVTYYHTGGGTQPLYFTSGKLTPVQITTAHTCPSNITNGINFPLSGNTTIQLSNQYINAEIGYANLLYNYNQLINGGNTTAMLAQLQLDWSQDAWTLRNELIASSPYLTEEVLEEAVMEDVLPHAMLLEVCLANPEATRSASFIDFLETQAPNPMPSYMIDMIAANSDSTTNRSNMESALGSFGSEMAFASNMILIDLKLDTVDKADSVRYWQKRRETMEGQYELAESFLADEMYDSALAVLTAIPDSFDLSKAGLENDYNDMVTYVNFRKTIYNDDNIPDIMNLDSVKEADLLTFAQNSTGRASAMAWNILCFGYDHCIDYPPAPIEDGGSARRANPNINPKEFIRSQYYKLKVFPNPAGKYATFSWELVHLEGKAKLRIVDAFGREVSSKVISTLEGQWLWDTRSVGNGFYIYELRIENGEILNQGKVVIQK